MITPAAFRELVVSGEPVALAVVGDSTTSGFGANPGPSTWTNGLSYLCVNTSASPNWNSGDPYFINTTGFPSDAQQANKAIPSAVRLLRTYFEGLNPESRVYNYGGSGYRASNHVSGGTIATLAALSPKPQIVFIALGINSAKSGLSQDADLRTLVTQCQANDMTPVMVVEHNVGVYGSPSGSWLDTSTPDTWYPMDDWAACRASVIDVAADYSLDLIDLGSSDGALNIEWLYDSFHPSNLGYAEIYSRYRVWIEKDSLHVGGHAISDNAIAAGSIAGFDDIIVSSFDAVAPAAGVIVPPEILMIGGGAMIGYSAISEYGIAASADDSVIIVDAVCPMPVIEIDIVNGSGDTWQIDAVCPMPVIEIDFITSQDTTAQYDAIAPLPTASATILNGGMLAVDAVCPMPVVSVTISAPLIAQYDAIAPLPTFSATIESHPVFEVNAVAPMLVLDAQVLTGNVVAVDAVAPMFEVVSASIFRIDAVCPMPVVEVSIYTNPDATYDAILPMPVVSIVIFNGGTATPKTYVMNAAHGAVTQHLVNALAIGRIGSTDLVITSTGVYMLSGDTDDGVAFDASARFGKADLGSPQLKRMTSAYVGGSGEINMKMIVDGGDETPQYTSTHEDNVISISRVKMGRGTKSHYWQPELSGQKFTVNSLDMEPEILHRKVS